MSYSKHLDKYPSEFGELVLAASLNAVEVPFESPKEAQRFQGRFYAYLGAINRVAATPEGLAEELKELISASKKVQLRQSGSTVLVRPLDQDEDASLIRSLLKSQPAEPSPKDILMVPINRRNLPPWLADLAEKRSTTPGK